MNLLLLFLLGGLWGTSFLFIKIVVSEVGPLTLVTGRLAMATILMWAILLLRGERPPRSWTRWRGYALLGLLNGALPYSLISWGEQYIPSGWAALLQSTTPLFTILLAHFLTDDDRVTGEKIFGVLLGFAGVGLLMWPEVRGGISASLWGLLAIVGSSVSYAAAAIYARERFGGQSPMVSSAGQFTMGLAFILPLSLALEQPFALAPSWRTLASWAADGVIWSHGMALLPSWPALVSWAGLAILGTVIAYAIYFYLIQRTSATFVTMTTYIVPINGLILGALLLGESISPTLLISLGLILGGVLLVRQ
jgi:drug/metabolite transporter (DMT)-like permease